jgi:hypothetical protein
MFEYAVTAVPADGRIDVYVAVARQDSDVVVALGVEGDHGYVAPLSLTRALICAIRIVTAIGGGFERGVRDGRMVFGIVAPLAPPNTAGD